MCLLKRLTRVKGLETDLGGILFDSCVVQLCVSVCFQQEQPSGEASVCESHILVTETWLNRAFLLLLQLVAILKCHLNICCFLM